MTETPLVDDLDRKFAQINERIDTISQAILGMQDAFLSLKTVLETMNHEDWDRNNCVHLSTTTNLTVRKFLNEKNSDCKRGDWCTTLLERSATRVLHRYIQRGNQAAIELIDKYVKWSEENFKDADCHNEQCYKNAMNVFKALRELLEASRNPAMLLSTNVFLLGRNGEQRQSTEADICNRLVPLSNVTRLQILGILEKGGRNYAFLERETGIKAGHLRFHLNKLLAVGYVVQERSQHLYVITRNGLKALQVSRELCNVML